ncbi:DUF4893 domain-containing protein [Allosphingosinicella vermicomposti]|uniref:DUF4893 domain-containing protein n=1 Tax=Allosphingosinicella vermicomposti TaxID=614671 RepID=UPI00131A4EF2|nr:DUF4893 domain-containing protein [Allosphingosinicella vermicomposti]
MDGAMMIGFLAFAVACSAAQDGENQPCTNAALAGSEWRVQATEDDRDRLRRWRSAFVEGLTQARAEGHGAAIAAEGALLDPDAAIPFVDIPPGDYRCRTLKVGGAYLSYVAYPYFNCRIHKADGKMHFTTLDGSQRPIGILYPDGDTRRIFLGTLQLGDEQRSFRYGDDRERDMAGILDRLDERRWRLLLPYPRFESTIDVIEIVPGE